MEKRIIFPSEWVTQSGVMLTWPHAGTDWNRMLEDVQSCFIEIAAQIAKREQLLIVTPCVETVRTQIEHRVTMRNVFFCRTESNDTWARDHAPITLLEGEVPLFLDFRFNGWGEKFAADLDNQISKKIIEKGCLRGQYIDYLDFVFEGGSIESDGKGTLMTTSQCLLARNRNNLSREEIDTYLRKRLVANRVLWLDYGYLKGDDTDSHVDTLARFCPNDTIVYVKCEDVEDEHFEELLKMERQLFGFRTVDGKPYRLLPLPMPESIVDKGERLPATYANFLVINEAVLLPTYNQPDKDEEAKSVLQEAFPDREIVGVDCCTLIKQHGSLHCVTMQFPKQVKIQGE